MSVITTFPFMTPANYTAVNAEIAGGVGRLALSDLPAQNFTQDFASDVGFTYDNALSEFVAGVLQQKDRTPANSVMATRFAALSINLDWHKEAGSLVGTLYGAPSVATGKLVCTGAQGVYYMRNTSAVETHKFKYTPNYTGAPPANINIISSVNGVDVVDRFFLTNSPSGNTLRMSCNKADGTQVLSTATTIAVWSPTALQEYEFEVVIDSINGEFHIFVDGILLGTLNVPVWTRGTAAARYYVGANPDLYDRAEGSFDDYILFSDAQHTADYAPGYTVPASIYGTDTIDLPDFNYGGQGSLQSLDAFTSTETNDPHYTFEGKYWDGAAWSVSDGSRAQSNPKAIALANLATLAVTGETVLSVQVIWADSNIKTNISQLDIGYTGQELASEGSLLTNNSFVAKDIIDFQAIETIVLNTDIKYVMCANGSEFYHDGVNWVASNGTNAQANTLAEVQANIDDLLTVNSTVKILVILTSADNIANPEIDSITVTYDFGAIEAADPNQCQVYGFLKDAENQPIVGAAIDVQANRDLDEYTEAADRIITTVSKKTTDANGFFSFNMIISADYEVGGTQPMQFILIITPAGAVLPIYKNGLEGTDSKAILFEVPNQASVNITDQIGAI